MINKILSNIINNINRKSDYYIAIIQIDNIKYLNFGQYYFTITKVNNSKIYDSSYNKFYKSSTSCMIDAIKCYMKFK